MGREADPSIKAALLEDVLQYLLAEGLQEFSLRPMAKAIGSNARMLIYHFGSKEELIVEALGLLQKKTLLQLGEKSSVESELREGLRGLWQLFTAPAMAPVVRLFVEVDVLAFKGEPVYLKFAKEMVELWGDFVQGQLGLSSKLQAHLIVNTLTGLFLDRAVTGESQRTDESFEIFVDLFVAGASRRE